MHSPQSVQTQVRAEIKGQVGYLILDRPERKNALSFEMWKEVSHVIGGFGANPNLRVVVLRGAGDLPFCSGADISEFETVRADAEGARAYEEANVVAFDAIAACPLPTIAMIRGFCMGGGMGLAAACDLRIASESAEFAIPPGKLGLAYPPSAIRYIVAAIGSSNAKDLLYSARRLRAQEAEKMGLINKLVSEAALEPEIEKLASEIAQNAPLSLKAGKLAINYAAGYEFAQDKKAVKDAADRCFDSADYREGRSAFLEKRKARFSGE